MLCCINQNAHIVPYSDFLLHINTGLTEMNEMFDLYPVYGLSFTNMFRAIRLFCMCFAYVNMVTFDTG